MIFESFKNFLGNPAFVVTLALIDINFMNESMKIKIIATMIVIFCGIYAYFYNYNLVGAGVVIFALTILNLAIWITRRVNASRSPE